MRGFVRPFFLALLLASVPASAQEPQQPTQPSEQQQEGQGKLQKPKTPFSAQGLVRAGAGDVYGGIKPSVEGDVALGADGKRVHFDANALAGAYFVVGGGGKRQTLINEWSGFEGGVRVPLFAIPGNVTATYSTGGKYRDRDGIEAKHESIAIRGKALLGEQALIEAGFTRSELRDLKNAGLFQNDPGVGEGKSRVLDVNGTYSVMKFSWGEVAAYGGYTYIKRTYAFPNAPTGAFEIGTGFHATQGGVRILFGSSKPAN